MSVTPAAERSRATYRDAVAAVTPLGWSLLVAGVIGWVAGALLGWVELLTIGAACLLVVVISVLLTVGSVRLDVDLGITPPRVTAGESSQVGVTVRSLRRSGLLPISLEIPIGVSSEPIALPHLARGASVEEKFLITTTRRGVIVVGPATAVRGDPVGLVRRTSTWGGVKELCVHPITVRLDPLGAGLLRDLEGTTTTQTSMSDLAFHALREYAPGDDRRHILWRSSARVESLGDSDTFMVRQFLDTRRSHVTIVVDGRAASYLDPVDFETAISAAASVARRAIADGMPTTVLVSQRTAHQAKMQVTMDAFARAEAGGDSLTALGLRAFRLAPDTSVALFVTGANSSVADLQHAASHFAPEVRQVAIQVDPTSPASVQPLDTMTVLTLPRLSSLAVVLGGFVA